jgi:hypothetical protein
MRSQRNWAYFIAGQAGVTPVAFGCPGVAKTASCRALAQQTGRLFVPFVLQHHLPEDFGGFPVVRSIQLGSQARDVMRRVPDERLVAAQSQPSLVLFDELTNAGPAQQAAALLLIQDGIPGAWLFAAANPPELAAAGVELTPPLVNRLCVLQWQADEAAWDEGMRNGMTFPAPEVPVLPAHWRDWCVKWGRLLVAFRHRFPDLWQAPPQDPTQAAAPYPTPRSWTHTGLLLAAAESVGADESVQAELIYGCVGQAAGTTFLKWLSEQGLPDPEDALRDPARFRLPSRGDLAVAALASVINRVRETATPDRWEACRDVLEVAWSQSQEIATTAEGGLWRIKPEGYAPRVRNGIATQMAAARLGSA